ncbi:TlpA disulfide reductase family protein [Priestia aryabhattai]|uniref:TlpA disulfide reductase family protein n=1 Tax=Priestia aryabhattai TaxID=412384 RepID=UPI00237FE7E5|nr:TlpA disulfide reductase family protein [Priestia aryabhattai]WDW10731.1 TlpA disulfide reductase family protein [Priestia aryabhattai]
MNWKLVLVVVLCTGIGLFLYNEYKGSNSTNYLNENKIHNEQASTESAPKGEVGILEGQIVPNIQLETLDGKAFNLKDYQGKTVILNFWATWCPPCKAEMPDMQKFYEEYKNKNVEIIAVNLTSAEKNKEDIKRFTDEYGITFTVPLDKNGEISNQFNVVSIPSSYLIDDKGVIRRHVVGPMSYNWMVDEVKKAQ